MDLCCGRKLANAFLEIPSEVPEPVDRFFCCTLFTAFLSEAGTLYWRGIYPFNERRKLWEKARSKKKQVTNTNAEIVVGSEVRTKSTPIYSFGSVAVNFTGGLPMIGTLYEDAWTLNETCRFRVQTPENYDNSPIGTSEKEKQREKRVSFSLAVGNRKRAAPTASDELAEGTGGAQPAAASSGSGNGQSSGTSAQSKESAWAIKDVVFIHEEAINDISVVKIVDGSYCGVVFKSTLDRLEREGQSAHFDLAKLGIRLMRKDDLVPVTNASRAASRAPENFQSQFRSVRLPSTVQRIISLAIDGIGFRVLCEKNQRVHLLRISCLGKLLSDHAMPINLRALCSSVEGITESHLPSVNNFGEEGILMLRDSTGAALPLLRDAAGGFQELAYTGLGKFYRFGLVIRYLKTSGDINVPAICTEPTSASKTSKGPTSKSANRMLYLTGHPSRSQPTLRFTDHRIVDASYT